MSARKSLVLIGAGRMGTALARGWLAADKSFDLSVIAPRPSQKVKDWAAEKKVHLNSEPAPVDVLVIALKPQVFPSVREALTPWIGKKTLVISVMAGYRLKQLKEKLGTDRVVRAMPNTPGAIGQGVTLLCASKDARTVDINLSRRLLKPLGLVEGPFDEKLLPAATAISGCGPAYLFLLAEVMAMAGEAEGLPSDMAARLARATVEGSAALLAQSEESPSSLRHAVTSPKGVTQAALDILMDEGGMASIMRQAMRAAIRRERQLSEAND